MQGIDFNRFLWFNTRMFRCGKFFSHAAPWAGLAVLVCFFAACGPRKIGYAVLLWSADEAEMETGAVLPVYEESRLKQTYITGGAAKEAESRKNEIETWRVQFFPKEEGARTFSAGFEGVKDLYARANRSALPVREKADRLSRQVYRLRQNEIIKILALSSTPSNENGLQGFWYKVLTEEGISGYCFNYYLTLYNAKTNTVITNSPDSAQQAIEAILTNSWRPQVFREMMAADRVDLARFRSSYGLFFDEDPRRIRILLPEVSFSTPFSRIRKASADTYLAEDSDVQLQLRSSSTELAVSYAYNGGRRTDVFLSFKEDVEAVIAREAERRQKSLFGFLKDGGCLRSNAYGEINISHTGEFTWTDYERLVPAAIPSGAGASGKVEFSVFMSAELQSSYRGVITFGFADGDMRANFFYRFTQQGTQLIHIPPERIEENLVRHSPMNPLVLFFTVS